MSFVELWTVVSAFSTPETTRNMVMRPANGSATVFQTKAAAGPPSEAATLDLVARFDAPGLDRPLRGRRHIRQDGVEQRLHPDVRRGRRAQHGKDAAGADAALQPGQQFLLRQRSRIEELLHQRIVGFGHHLDERFARAAGLGFELGRDRRSRTACRCRRPRTSAPSSPRGQRRRGMPSPRRSEAAPARPSGRMRPAAIRSTARGSRAHDRAGSAR